MSYVHHPPPPRPPHKNYGTSNVCAWIDLETTQLDPKTGHILEIAVIITTGFEMKELKRMHIIVHQEPKVFDDMSDWCQDQHRKPRPDENGRSLIDLCHHSTVTLKKAEKLLGDFLDHFRQGKWIIMWGSSIRLDYDFLTHHMPSMKRRLHYRLGDVSSVMETCKRFYPGLRLPHADTSHCAMDDIESSLFLLRWLRKTCFLALPQFMFHEDETPAKTFRWGFDGVGGHRVPSSLDYIDYHVPGPPTEEEKISALRSELDTMAAACADAFKAILRNNKAK